MASEGPAAQEQPRQVVGNAHQRLVVRPFKHASDMNATAAMRSKCTLWGFLVSIATDLKAANGIRFEEAYRICYNLVLHRYGKDCEHMIRFAINLLVRTHTHTHQLKESVTRINDIYLYYNRTVAKSMKYATADEILESVLQAEIVQHTRRLEMKARVQRVWEDYYWAPTGLPGTFMAKRKPEWDRLAGVKEVPSSKRARLDLVE